MGNNNLADTALDLQMGKLVRSMRQARGLSLRVVAEECDVSVSYMSQLERGMTSPSLRVIGNLSALFDVPIREFFSDASSETGAQTGPVLRAAQRPKISNWLTGIQKEILTPSSVETDLDLTLYMVVIEPGGTTGDTPFSHQGVEAGIVKEGTLKLEINGESYTLNPGDSFNFCSQLPHKFWNPGQALTRVYWINSRDKATGDGHSGSS
jgi:transcriptional regulator with XRE-family HTH domain